MRTGTSLLAIALFVAACAGSPTPSPSPAARAISGTFTLNQHGEPLGGGPDTCAGTGGYGDIGAGTDVTVTDATGKIVGLGHLASPHEVNFDICRYTFTVPDLAATDFYGIEVSHRGAVRYSASDLEAKGWTIELSLGQ